MTRHRRYTTSGVAIIGLLTAASTIVAQSTRAQYPDILANSFVSINLGYVHHPFTNSHLEDGFTAESVDIPHMGLRVNLGHQFNEHWSVQISYMRPFKWAAFRNVNGDQKNHSAWTNLSGLTAKYRWPVMRKISLYGEGGLGLVMRRGFSNEVRQMRNINVANLLLGAGMHLHLSEHWDLLGSIAYSPPISTRRHPQTLFATGGFAYYFRPLSEEKVRSNASTPYYFPLHVIQVGYATDVLGFGVNGFLTHRSGRFGIPIFWEGNVYISRGAGVTYQCNIFHSRRAFSFDAGASLATWRSDLNGARFFTISVFPAVKFWFLRSTAVDLYFCYSVAGPTFITQTIIDDLDTGEKFTFQDFMGIGGFVGKRRAFNFELRIAHYSNGNIFPANDGIAIPLTLNFGYAVR